MLLPDLNTYKINVANVSDIPTIAPVLSKSESNRLLIIKALLHAELNNLKISDANDTQLLLKLLQQKQHAYNAQDAGTVMRFLTAYLAAKPGMHVLTGTERMMQRPIGALVKALNQLGAKIDYANAIGFPPLKIEGRSLTGNYVNMDAGISSQFISALLLVAPYFLKPLTLNLQGHTVSEPYIETTIAMMQHFGVNVVKQEQTYRVPVMHYTDSDFAVEADWSAAAYYYALVALGVVSQLTLKGYKANSLQADSALVHVFETLGVNTIFKPDGITLFNKKSSLPQQIDLNCITFPDAVPAIAVACAGLGIAANLTGLQTLVIKETNRIKALQSNLQLCGFNVASTSNSLSINGKLFYKGGLLKMYNDHRIAMAFAILAKATDGLVIDDVACVSKSYPGFWVDIKHCGIFIE
ncbi:MAG: 3-phosphoshikimate 1-carboxyvinyltransferase [Bacteroidia bacterium]|nr:3-phosphoshikimate 1-carboxyvinyltransferase [Bacteroidia bacterium]